MQSDVLVIIFLREISLHGILVDGVDQFCSLVLRVEVQQWEDEGISLPVGGQSEEGVKADDVVEEAGHQEDCGQIGMKDAVLSVFIIRAEGHRTLSTLFIDHRVFIINRGIVFTAWW